MKHRYTQMRDLKDAKAIVAVIGFMAVFQALMTLGNSSPTIKSPTYQNDFEKTEIGKVPDDLMVLGGEFVVKADGTNKVLELPGAPLDSFAVQFGTGESENIVASAKVFGTGKGRRFPTFGIGVGGISGWKLQIAPGKKAVELIRDTDLKATLPFDWKSGEWTQLKLQLRKVKDGEWVIEGKAWQSGGEPKEWTISAKETAEATGGNCSIFGSPFAGTPIWFDDLRVAPYSK